MSACDKVGKACRDITSIAQLQCALWQVSAWNRVPKADLIEAILAILAKLNHVPSAEADMLHGIIHKRMADLAGTGSNLDYAQLYIFAQGITLGML